MSRQSKEIRSIGRRSLHGAHRNRSSRDLQSNYILVKYVPTLKLSKSRKSSEVTNGPAAKDWHSMIYIYIYNYIHPKMRRILVLSVGHTGCFPLRFETVLQPIESLLGNECFYIRYGHNVVRTKIARDGKKGSRYALSSYGAVMRKSTMNRNNALQTITRL
jgi:hypothetical protein